MEIVGPRGHRVKAALLLLLAGCFWRTYGSLAATHTDLLVALVVGEHLGLRLEQA